MTEQYIKLSDLKAIMCEDCNLCQDPNLMCDYQYIFEKVQKADVTEIVHGHWNEKADCSVCGMPAPTDDRIDFINISELNYCPYCGAKMY